MGSCLSQPFVAPCCRCYQIRIYPRETSRSMVKDLPKGSTLFGRYRTVRNIEEQTRGVLYRMGYRELFPDDIYRYMYSCEKCFEEAGKIESSAWEYKREGFWRTSS